MSIKFHSLYQCISLINTTKSFIHKLKVKYLIKQILISRANAITSIQKHFHYVLFKKCILIYSILSFRLTKIAQLQNKFRSFLCYSHFKNLLSNKYIFFYNHPYKKGNTLSLILPSYKTKLQFKYSKYLKEYYVSINNVKCIRKKILCIFSVNNIKIIESKYEVIMNSHGEFLNVLYSSMIHKTMKKRNGHKIIKVKKRNFSLNSLSSSSISDGLKENICVNQRHCSINERMSILKKNLNYQEDNKETEREKEGGLREKKVSFSKNLHMLYQYNNVIYLRSYYCS